MRVRNTPVTTRCEYLHHRSTTAPAPRRALGPASLPTQVRAAPPAAPRSCAAAYRLAPHPGPCSARRALPPAPLARLAACRGLALAGASSQPISPPRACRRALPAHLQAHLTGPRLPAPPPFPPSRPTSLPRACRRLLPARLQAHLTGPRLLPSRLPDPPHCPALAGASSLPAPASASSLPTSLPRALPARPLPPHCPRLPARPPTCLTARRCRAPAGAASPPALPLRGRRSADAAPLRPVEQKPIRPNRTRHAPNISSSRLTPLAPVDNHHHAGGHPPRPTILP